MYVWFQVVYYENKTSLLELGARPSPSITPGVRSYVTPGVRPSPSITQSPGARPSPSFSAGDADGLKKQIYHLLKVYDRGLLLTQLGKVYRKEYGSDLHQYHIETIKHFPGVEITE